MARKNLSPTAANIISSLGIRGALKGVPEGKEAKDAAGFVPILDENGKLSVDFIPSTAFKELIEPITNVLVVDGGVETGGNGSVVAPYKTIYDAAVNLKSDTGGRCAIVIAPGEYTSELDLNAKFADAPREAYVIGIGEVKISGASVSFWGFKANGSVYLQNINTDALSILAEGQASIGSGRIYILGRSTIGELNVGSSAEVFISPETYVGSTDARAVHYLAEDGRVANTSEVSGSTVKDALNTLGGRRIRLRPIVMTDSGFDYGDLTDIPAASGGSYEVYDIIAQNAGILAGLNNLLARTKNVVAETVTAKKVTTEVVETDELRVDSIKIGGYEISIDAHGYLVVLDGDGDVKPPSKTILIEDITTHALYALGIKNGRLYVTEDDGSESSDVIRYISLEDQMTHVLYTVYMSDGRLVLDGDTSDSGSDGGMKSKLYVLDGNAGLYHELSAICEDGEGGKVVFSLDQNGIPPAQLETVQ